jgi:hypothetical protein
VEYAVVMGACVMIYISSVIKTGAGNNKFKMGDRQKHRQHKPTFIF